MRLILMLMLSFLSILVGSSTYALPILFVDVDPVTPGVQTELDILIGEEFEVDIVVEDVGTAPPDGPLSSFEFDLDFDPSILLPIGVVDGGFLTIPLPVEEDLNPPDVNFAEITLGPFPVSGDGVLAEITFDTIGVGTSPLDINDVTLKFPFFPPLGFFGGDIPIAGVNDASVNATPEPGTMLLLSTGIAGLALWRRRRLKGKKKERDALK